MHRLVHVDLRTEHGHGGWKIPGFSRLCLVIHRCIGELVQASCMSHLSCSRLSTRTRLLRYLPLSQQATKWDLGVSASVSLRKLVVSHYNVLVKLLPAYRGFFIIIRLDCNISSLSVISRTLHHPMRISRNRSDTGGSAGVRSSMVC
jgi:hypothetical protein